MSSTKCQIYVLYDTFQAQNQCNISKSFGFKILKEFIPKDFFGIFRILFTMKQLHHEIKATIGTIYKN